MANCTKGGYKEKDKEFLKKFFIFVIMYSSLHNGYFSEETSK